MKENFIFSITMDWLKCNICFNTFNELILRPRSLNCGHSFCEKCINTAIQNKTLTCPQCRKVHEINSALDLPINFNLEGLLKSLYCGSQDLSEGAISNPIEGESDTDDDKSEIHGSLKSLLEQQEKSLSSQKELLKTSAGICYEHPSKECLHRCVVHKSWVCEECIEEQGDHPKDICKINSFKDEIENRRQEHKKTLDNERQFCDETLSVIENHISFLRDEREQHISLVNSLQDLVNMHKKEEENLQNEITSYENIIEEGKNVKKILLDVEVTVLNAATLDESNVARDMVKSKNADTRNWGKTSQKEVDEGKIKVEGSTHLAVATKISLDYREKCSMSHPELKKGINETSGGFEKLIKKTKLREIEVTRQLLNRITHLYEDELNDIASTKKNPGNIWDIVVKIQVIFLELMSKNSAETDDEDGDDEDIDIEGYETTIWAVEASHKEGSVLAGELYIHDGNLFLSSLETWDSLPRKGITLPLEKLEDYMSLPRHVYLSFSDTQKSQNLGYFVICINEKAPRRAQQFIDLCLGRTGSTYSGSNKIGVRDKGKPTEYLYCKYYLDTNKQYSDKNLFTNLEKIESIALKQGIVVNHGSGGFRILTRCKHADAPSSRPVFNPTNCQGVVIGMVVSGLPLLEMIINDNLVGAQNSSKSKVQIDECGLFIDSNSLKVDT